MKQKAKIESNTKQPACETIPTCAFCKLLRPVLYNIGNGKLVCIPCMAEQCTKNLNKHVAEGCALVAAHGGDGWCLEVHTPEDKVIALLAWPEHWPKTMTMAALQRAGFTIA